MTGTKAQTASVGLEMAKPNSVPTSAFLTERGKSTKQCAPEISHYCDATLPDSNVKI
jgi:hypothetical protein